MDLGQERVGLHFRSLRQSCSENRTPVPRAAGKSVLLGAIRRVDLCTSTPGLKFVTLGFGFSKALNFIQSAS